MKRHAILIVFVAALLVACARGAAPVRAVYLVQGPGQLDPAELEAHPQVAVVDTFADLQRLARSKVALWIDKDAVDLVDGQWLDQAPQRYYPLVVVGYSDALYAFREALPGLRIVGPYVDWSTKTVEPGFSVWMLHEGTGASRSAYMKGYEGAPTVQAIFEKTNALLDGRSVPVEAVPEERPSPTPTFTPGPVPLPVQPVASPFERHHLSPGETIARAGLFFMPVATGEIEAWTLPGEEDAWYRTSPDNRWLIAYTPDAAYAADRRGGAAFRWGRNSPHLLAAQGGYLLFRDDAGQVWIAGPGQAEPVALPFRPKAPQPVMSPDGQAAAILNGRTLCLVQLKSATCRAIGEVAAPPEGYRQSMSLGATRRREAIVLTTYLTADTGADQKTVRRVERYSWQGQRLGELTLPGGGWYALSPDGRLVVWEERLSHLTQAVVVADAATLAPRFQVTGASLCFHDYGGGDWLADSSGFIVRTSAGYRIVTLDGGLVAAPTLGVPGDQQGLTDEPLPAPDRSDLFAIGRRAVVDASGRCLASPALGDAGSEWSHPADLSPWGLDSREMRFALPHLGHGGQCGDWEYALPARVEPAPFGPLVLAVGLPAGECADLRAEPGLSARALACLSGGTRLSPAPAAEAGQSEDGLYHLSPSVAWTDNSYWLRVRAPGGQEGWVDAKAARIGWAP